MTMETIVTGCYECNQDEALDENVLHDGHLLCVDCAKRCKPDCSEVRL